MGLFDDIDPITTLLYDGVTSSGDWYGGLDAMSRAYGGVGFHYLALDGRNLSVLEAMATMELPAAAVYDYENHYIHDDPRMALAMRQTAGSSWADHDYLDKRVMSRAPIYTDLLIPNGARHVLAVCVRADADRSEFLGFFRPSDADLTSEEERVFLRRLTPHIQRASALRTRMAELARHAAMGLSALEHVAQGVAVVDGQGRVLHMNRVAESFAAADGPCRVLQGRLQFVAAAEQARFVALAAAACVQAAAPGKAEVRLPAAGAFRVEGAVPALAVSVVPLKASHPLAAFRQMNLALVVFSGMGMDTAGAGVDTQVLRELWGLTATEARLVLALTAGRSIKEFAEVEGCSWHTVRTHLRNAMLKSGCRRQRDLVQMVQSLVPGLG